MTDYLAKKQWVVLLTNTIVGYVDDDYATLMRQALKNGATAVELPDGSYFPARNLVLLSPEAYDTFSRHERGMYKCRYGSWH